MSEQSNKSVMFPQQRLALFGLRLPYLTRNRLQQSGIYCVPRLSVVEQRSTRLYLIRGHESGGAVADLGCYCGFTKDSGEPLGWFQRIETIGVNGLHARVLTTSLVRIQVLRVMHTYDLLITRHSLPTVSSNRPPRLMNSILFRGRQGTLQLELWGKDKELRGSVYPIFHDRGGDQLVFPTPFTDAVRKAVAAVTCCGCDHSHLLTAPIATFGPDGSETQTAASEEASVEHAVEAA